MVGWTNEETFKFIELYRNAACIWNPAHKNHKDKKKVNDAWVRISDAMGVSVDELKRKKETLLSAFRLNHKKVIASRKSGAEEDEVFKPVWVYYEALAAFMTDVYEYKSTMTPQVYVEDGFTLVEEEDRASSPLNNEIIENKIIPRNQEDDCELYGKLLAKKLRNFTELDRMDLMYEIDGMLLKKRRLLYESDSP